MKELTDPQIEDAIGRIDDNRALNAIKRPENCGTGFCSCIECVVESAPQSPAREAVQLPPLPMPVSLALFAGVAMQGPEMRLLAESYEPGCAQYTAEQMHAYATAALAVQQEEVARLLDALETIAVRLENAHGNSTFHPTVARIARAALNTKGSKE